ncbi:MAG: hypothetical protein DHS20C02_10280 [Micavibrio sp.]|nr:MAG: hypothetical protein DHS20C02_10280 [Micavibrio sp.]
MSNELSNLKKQRKRRAWPEKRRKAQAERAKTQKPWKHSTGPKTAEGRAKTSQNAYKHGFYDVEMRNLRRILRLQRHYLRGLLAGHRPENGG